VKGSQAIYLVARREYVERVREKSFLVGIAVTMVIILAIVLVPPLVFGDDDASVVGLVGEASRPYAEALATVAPELDLDVETVTLSSALEAEQALADGEVEAAVIDGETLLTSAGPADRLRTTLQAVAQQFLKLLQALRAGG
jgi:ABC-2 type transport system permease protein